MELYGKSLISNPFLNKGTAFTEEERKSYKLEGLLPAGVRTIEEQHQEVYEKLQKIDSPLEKHNYLMEVHNRNRTLFFYIVGKHVSELLPIIYTPTIADAVIDYQEYYQVFQDAVYLSINDPDGIKEALENGSRDLDDIKLMVITDGEGVLGIGDWGVQGVAIVVGKLAVYSVASGINPRSVLPVVIDAGTNNQALLDSPTYIGNKMEREKSDKFYAYIDRFVTESSDLFPNVLFHWEDFGRDTAATILEKYQNDICTFNDDIQGTGIMMAAAVNSVVMVTEKPLKEHRVVIFGAGTAGIGIADQIKTELVMAGVEEEAAYAHFYLVDRYGLICEYTQDLTSGQKRYARKASEFPSQLTDLVDIVHAVKPTILIGSSGQPGSFTKEVIEAMATYNERPAIMPISNPSRLCEAQAEDIIKWTDGMALVVTGSPSAPVEYKGTTYFIGQANNALLYPGLGFGIVVAQASRVTDTMLSAAANALADLQDVTKLGAPLLPPVDQLREASILVASSVLKAAITEGVSSVETDDVIDEVKKHIWDATY